MIACWLGFKVFSVRRCQRYTGALSVADRPTMKTIALFFVYTAPYFWKKPVFLFIILHSIPPPLKSNLCIAYLGFNQYCKRYPILWILGGNKSEERDENINTEYFSCCYPKA